MATKVEKIFGVCRFQLSVAFRRKTIQTTGMKNFLGKNAKIRKEQDAYISMENGTFINDRTTVGAFMTGKLVIGKNNYFSTNCNIICLNRIEIGNNNLFAQNVVIVDHGHQYEKHAQNMCDQGYKLGSVKIGSDCWICANVVICSDSDICDHVIVSANSVVKGSLSKPGIYAGNPARLVKPLLKENG